MQLTSTEYASLRDALLDALQKPQDLQEAMRYAEIPLYEVGFGGSMKDAVLQAIQFAEARDLPAQLVAGARVVNGTNVKLLKLATSIGASPGHATEATAAGRVDDLERMIDLDRGIADLGRFAARIQEYVQRVCAVELGGNAGTGFLIGPRTVLTNYHVVEDVIKDRFPAAKVVLRFDYRRDRDGIVFNGGTAARLADDWLVDSSPYSGFDSTPYVEGAAPGADQLDYAVLRLAEPVGSQPVGGMVDAQRGWVEPRAGVYDFANDSYLMVVQHPCHDPISYDYAKDAVIRTVGDLLRVHYRVNTMPGSSGSPVVDRNLDLVALHHAGEPGSADRFLPCKERVTPATYNQGIPISTIQRHLESRDLGWVFGEESP